jgi:hypothetical protein
VGTDELEAISDEPVQKTFKGATFKRKFKIAEKRTYP